MDKKMLKIRMRQKRKKPEFLRQEYYTHPKRLGRKWRRPRGRTSKLRYKEKARGGFPSIGYSSPASVRGLSRFGYKFVRVSNMQDLGKITDTKSEMIMIAAGVGAKKKLEILKAAKEKGILVFNRPKKSLEKTKKPDTKSNPDKGKEKKIQTKKDEKKSETKKEDIKPKQEKPEVKPEEKR